MTSLVTLLTDFGTADGYVAEMKGSLLTHSPDAFIVDVSHDIRAHDIAQARDSVARYWHSFPVGTVHIVVVDPGVGTDRAAIAMCADHRFLIAPDNGVLTAPLQHPGATTVRLAIPSGASPTFQGRDVFAPVAAALLVGTPLGQLGTLHPHPLLLPVRVPVRDDQGILGEVVSIDRFGNAITNIDDLPQAMGVCEVHGHALLVRRTYGDVEVGAALALRGSSGHLEVAVRDGSAADRLGLLRGMPVRVRPS
jgi:S-adenosylmethionine hydrolase